MISLLLVVFALTACGTPASQGAAATVVPAATAKPTPEVTPLATPGAAPRLEGQALTDALRSGGYVLFVRHTKTDFAQQDTDDERLADCTRQRSLTEQGRSEAKELGAAFQRLHIQVGSLLSSRYCRTLETARLAFGEPEATDDLTGFYIAPSNAERKRRNEALRLLLSTPPEPGRNTVLVSHQYNLGDVTGLESKEGDTLVFAPGGPAGFRLVARVAIGEWQALSQ